MRITDLFIQRPVLSCVLSLLVLVAGLRSMQSLPVEQFPHTVSGTVEVVTQYYGADPATVAGFVTTPLEARISQAEGIDYVASNSSLGVSDITVYLKLNVDPARALAEIQSYVTAATSQFPPGVQASSITVSSGTGGVMNVTMDSDVLSTGQVSDYAQRVVKPRLQAVPGVQVVNIQGAPQVVMRVWLDPDRLAAVGMTPADVQNALANNNFVSGAGQTLGAMTFVNLDITSGLHTAAEFGELILRQDGGRIIRLGDVARVELGKDPDTLQVYSNGRPGVFIQIKPTPSANALTLTRALAERIEEIRKQMPPGLRLSILHDTGGFIRTSIREVIATLFEALLIVSLVVFAFLGSPRSILIPLITIPLSLIGTFALMSMLDFSINLLTLLALVLAIGLVVDDAIIIVENVNRHLAAGMAPMRAASVAVRELAMPILAMTVVLVAVYVPLSLQGGLTGALFTQFAFTLAGAVTISALLALTLTPMMSSRLLLTRQEVMSARTFAERLEQATDRLLEKLQAYYLHSLRRTLQLQPLVLLVGALVLVSIFFLYTGSKSELSPREDRGVLVTSGEGSPNSTSDGLAIYSRQIQDAYRAIPEMHSYWHIVDAPDVEGGLVLKDWSERKRSAFAIGNKLQDTLQNVAGLDMAVYEPPYLPGSQGLPVGFVLQSSGDFEQLDTVSDAFLAKAKASGLFSYAEKDLRIDQPQSTIVVDRAKLSTLGLTMNDLATSLNTILGGGFVGFFSNDQRSYKVEPLAARRFRLNADQVLDYPIATIKGVPVPLRSVAHIVNSTVPESISHFQQLNATTISAIPRPGITQADAYRYLQQLADQMLPAGFGTDTVGSLRQYVHESSGFVATFALAMVVAYLALAALFESFRAPLIILVSVPMSIAGALLFVWLRVGGVSLNLFTEVGLVTLMGLISKHGILIIAVTQREQASGHSRQQAIELACSQRLRPILMTTAAMVLGVTPLMFVHGPGSASRFAIGLVVAAGLSIGTLFTLFVLPSVYLLFAAATAREHSGGLNEAMGVPGP
ncbi:efflux RND transporter permease subunit [Dyella acidiphila]|uniref:Efflux RND transporter permease subunit n=1 Tax=Dyella acidiphila TaxID=2775866 RepID=A0ABR9G9F6_9GAMM|nr:efflux RND transporter permease subunit [Dyella acidiphila]MBE1160656.1 efflux RND transporter permease subunit [Dyella acidiphila]